MESFKHFINILVDELKKSIEKELANEIQNKLNLHLANFEVTAPQSSTDNYLFIDELCQKHRVGQTTFYKILKQTKVHRERRGRFFAYSEKQFIIALRCFKPEKPRF
jgi:hypothetical protein